MLTLADIVAARERIAGGIYESPCVESIPLSQLTGARIQGEFRRVLGAAKPGIALPF